MITGMRNASDVEAFRLVDVFGCDAFSGNPVAVVRTAGELSDTEMQRIAQWLNLSETAFLLPPTTSEADYRVRIFTLARELPFAGHPSLGACHSWLAWGGVPRSDREILQECAIGLVPIRRTPGGHAFKGPALIRSGPVDDDYVEELAGILRIERQQIVDAQWVDNGPGWVALMLRSDEEVRAFEPSRRHAKRLDVGVVGRCPPGSDVAYEVRAIFSDAHGGLVEDPATGSLNASLAQWLFSTGRAGRDFVAAQGTRVGRSGRINVHIDFDDSVWVGGRTRTLFDGRMAFVERAEKDTSSDNEGAATR